MFRILSFFLILSSLLLAKPHANVSFTTIYNEAGDDYYLSYSRFFFGIRAGVPLPNDKELQFAYEQGNNVNCKGLDLKRFYLNGIQYFNSPADQLSSYILLNAGYETSTIHYHKPNQFFAGLGGGIRVNIHLPFYTYLEARLLKRFKTGDTDLVMTLGLAYQFETKALPDSPTINTHNTRPEIAPTTYTPVTQTATPATYTSELLAKAPAPEITEIERVTVKPRRSHASGRRSRYYIQLGIFARTDPRPLVRKARKRGFHVKVRHIKRDGRKMKLVLSGPYRSRKQAMRKLRRIKSIVPDAFIVRR